MTKYKEFSCVEKPAHKIISSYFAVKAFCFLIIMLFIVGVRIQILFLIKNIILLRQCGDCY